MCHRASGASSEAPTHLPRPVPHPRRCLPERPRGVLRTARKPAGCAHVGAARSCGGAVAEVGEAYLSVAPLLAVEVLSPAACRKDISMKRALYEECRVASFWAVDPDEPSLRVWELVGGALGEEPSVWSGHVPDLCLSATRRHPGNLRTYLVRGQNGGLTRPRTGVALGRIRDLRTRPRMAAHVQAAVPPPHWFRPQSLGMDPAGSAPLRRRPRVEAVPWTTWTPPPRGTGRGPTVR